MRTASVSCRIILVVLILLSSAWGAAERTAESGTAVISIAESFPDEKSIPGFVLRTGKEEKLGPYGEAVLQLVPEIWNDLTRPYPDLDLGDTIFILLTADQDLFQRAAGLGPEAGALAVAAPRPEKILILHPSGEMLLRSNLRETLTHELAHLLLYRVDPNVFPRTFHEAYAMTAAGEIRWEGEALLLRAAWTGRLASLDELNERFKNEETVQLAYAQALGLARYLQKEKGPDVLNAVVREVRAQKAAGRNPDFEGAFLTITDLTPELANELFLKEVRRKAWWIPLYDNRLVFFIGGIILILGYLFVRARGRRRLEEMEREERDALNEEEEKTR